jgi:putative ABC transport system ATP-binding protein
MAILEAKQLGKIYRIGTRDEVHALADVSVEVTAGSFVAFTGPSGSGKSTLLALLGALDRPSRGQVWFSGQDLSRCSDVALARIRRRMGFIFQNFSLIPRLPIWENVTYHLIPRSVRSWERRRRAVAVLSPLGLEAKAGAFPEELSGGEQQRVAIARALAGEPEVLIADEPTSNLDRAAAESLTQLFQTIHAQGKTVLVSSHDARIIATADVVYELAGGRLKSPQASVPDPNAFRNFRVE